MVLMALGVNYQTAAFPLRERLALDGGESSLRLMRCLIETGVAEEALFLSTCNRTELYCAGQETRSILECLAQEVQLSSTELLPFSYSHTELSAVQHVMRVASGLNSMVVGEVEILGQIKAAYRKACGMGTVGKNLSRLFETSFSVAKEVRSRTGISVNPVSVASTAVRLAERVCNDLKQATVLLIGAGKLIRLTATHLKRMGVHKMIVANRSPLRGEAVAQTYSAEFIGLDQIPNQLKGVDIVIAGARSAVPIIEKTMVEGALQHRGCRPLLMVDLAVPRNIAQEVNTLLGVHLYGIDDLQTLVEENRKKRAQSVLEAEQIIQVKAEQFMQWVRAQSAMHTLKNFRAKFESERDQVLTLGLRQLRLGKSPEIVLQRAIHTITNRLLHTPTQRLRRAGQLGEDQILDLMRELFGLNHETIDPA